MSKLRAAFTAAMCALALLFALSYAGRIHPIGDSFAVFRPWIAVTFAAVLIGTALLYSARWVKLGGAAVACVLVFQAAETWFDNQIATPPNWMVVVYQKNLNFRLKDPALLVADIRSVGAPFVTLQEVTPRNKAVLKSLVDDYPFHHWCPFNAVGGTAVASKFSVIEGSRRCAEGGFTAMKVDFNGQPTWIVSLHLHWPWPYRQAAHVDQLADDLAALKGPIIIGGDFNMTEGSYTLRRIQELTFTVRASGSGGTYVLRDVVPLKIDHVLLPTCGFTARRPLFGSDHRGVVARFGNDC